MVVAMGANPTGAADQFSDAGPTASVTASVGRRGARGLVTVAGSCDLDFVTPLVVNVDRLLATDVGEIWIDLRQVTAMTSIAAVALLRARRRAARFRVLVVLVPGEGPARPALEQEGVVSAFRTESELPADLIPDTSPRTTSATPRFVRTETPAPLPGPSVPRSIGPGDTQLLVEDPELADGLEGRRLMAARERLRVRVVSLRKGVWRDPRDVADGAELLILEGMLVRRVAHLGASGAELLGPGDILRAGTHPGEDISPWFTTGMRVLSHCRLAVLDDQFIEQLAGCPMVAKNLIDRAMARSHALAVSMAVAHYPRVDRRLLVLLWHLAQRWGHVTSRGVVLRLPLTHSILADLTAARRPSVTLALQQLERAGELTRDGSEWVLLGTPPTRSDQVPAPAALATPA